MHACMHATVGGEREWREILEGGGEMEESKLLWKSSLVPFGLDFGRRKDFKVKVKRNLWLLMGNELCHGWFPYFLLQIFYI